jgi:hypothetical protein
MLRKLFWKPIINISKKAFFLPLDLFPVHLERKFDSLYTFVHYMLYFWKVDLIFAVEICNLLFFLRFLLELWHVYGFLNISWLCGMIFFYIFRCCRLSLLNNSYTWNVFLTFILFWPLFNLIKSLKGKTGLFFKEGSFVTALETIFTIPFLTRAMKANEVRAFGVYVIVLLARSTKIALNHFLLFKL